MKEELLSYGTHCYTERALRLLSALHYAFDRLPKNWPKYSAGGVRILYRYHFTFGDDGEVVLASDDNMALRSLPDSTNTDLLLAHWLDGGMKLLKGSDWKKRNPDEVIGMWEVINFIPTSDSTAMNFYVGKQSMHVGTIKTTIKEILCIYDVMRKMDRKKIAGRYGEDLYDQVVGSADPFSKMKYEAAIAPLAELQKTWYERFTKDYDEYRKQADALRDAYEEKEVRSKREFEAVLEKTAREIHKNAFSN